MERSDWYWVKEYGEDNYEVIWLDDEVTLDDFEVIEAVKKPGVCEWHGVSFHDQIVSYDTSCGNVVTSKPIVYCPYCGRKIKLL